MKKDVFSVKFISTRNCFLYFSENWLWKLKDEHNNIATLVLEYGCGQKAYFSWSADASPVRDESVVCLNSLYAHALGIKEGEVVIVSLLPQLQPASHVQVSPLSADDWQVLMLKGDDVQSSLLDQVRVVWPGQVLIIWLSKSFHLRVLVETVHPCHPVGILQPLTEVVVLSSKMTASAGSTPASHKSTGGADAMVNSTTHICASDNGLVVRLLRGLRGWLPFLPEPANVNTDDGCENGPHNASHEDDLNSLMCGSTQKVSNWVFRVHPLQTQTPQRSKCILLYHQYNIYASRERLVLLGVDLPIDKSSVICRITKIPFPKPEVDKISSSGENSRTKKPDTSAVQQSQVFARLCFLEAEFAGLQSQLADHPSHESALFTRTTMDALQLCVGSKVHVELLSEEPPPTVTELHIAPCKVWDASLGSIDSVFRRHIVEVTQQFSLLLNSNATIPVCVAGTDVREFHVKLVPSSAKYALLDVETLAKCRLCIKDANLNDSSEKEAQVQHNVDFEGEMLGSLKVLLDEGLATLKLGLQIHQMANRLQYVNTVLSAVNILIVGKEGSGKSTLSKALCRHVGDPPHCVHAVHIKCRYLKGKKVETLQRLMGQWLEECVYYQPSVLVLDDLETIVGMPNLLEDASSAEGIYYSRVGERLVDTLREFQNSNDICVVATTSSLKKLDHTVIAPRGRHIFHTVLDIPDLTKADRLAVLEYVVNQTACSEGSFPSVDLNTLANQTEGYIIQDLVDLIDKAAFEMWKRSVSDNCCPILMDKDLELAKKNMIPLSLRGVDLFQDSSITWDDVGGLVEVKQLLEQILMWPSQYPELFVQCPLRPQSGLLLYGAPGTGKTHLAGAVAHHCGLNFISVKGPELLSKYIGASEEAVRNIFEKAQSAKPCILFFDEFDSLAPRRGHDSTGVTDRVVNQLLTQLDGVESLHGVWVVGATSRPDLLDPALLRPGRLDHAILCPLPQQEDRVSILRALSHNLTLADSVNLKDIAARTTGFTGADLQALLYTAQLSATNVAKSNLPDVLPACSGMEVPLKPDESVSEERLVVTQEHLLAALRSTRPSLSQQEKLKYELIYQKFSNTMMAGSTVEETIMLPQKATLA